MKKPYLLLLLFISLSLASCGWVKDTGQAKKKVEEFHTLFNNQQFQAIYDSADAGFKKASTEEEFRKLLEAIYKKLGKVTETKTVGFNANTNPMGTYVTLVQETKFEQGKGTESFRFIIRRRGAALLAYNINSNDLIMK